MSQSQRSVEDIRQAFVRGEIDADELRDQLRALDEDTDREELWARWADQGLFDRPIEQRGYTSFKGNRVRTVIPDEG